MKTKSQLRVGFRNECPWWINFTLHAEGDLSNWHILSREFPSWYNMIEGALLRQNVHIRWVGTGGTGSILTFQNESEKMMFLLRYS